MPLVLYNSQTRQKQAFTPISPGKIGLYVCGMTVYDYCHIGHARVLVAFDVLVRFLRSQQWQVNYVRNITDIDDKIITRANDNGEAISALTTRYINAMHADADMLGCLRPDVSPKATEYIQPMQDMIGTLIDKDLAYQANNGDVYYAVTKFAQYGKLSNRDLSQMQAGARVEADTASKRHPMDFVLWKSAKANEPHWSSAWGDGRPGWHIECSAMSTTCLGNHFDIHGGGGDLLFPHHENEIAQAEGATGEKYVNTWMHVGFVNVDGEKMSKSLGNFFTIRDVMQTFSAEVIRYFIIGSHYRSQINFSDAALAEAHQALTRLYTALKLTLEANPAGLPAATVLDDYQQRFDNAMHDDINTPEAMAILFELSRNLNKSLSDPTAGAHSAALYHTMRALGGVLGILQADPIAFVRAGKGNAPAVGGYSDQQIDTLVAARVAAKAQKNFSAADSIRSDLLSAGIVIEDSKLGSTWKRV